MRKNPNAKKILLNSFKIRIPVSLCKGYGGLRQFLHIPIPIPLYPYSYPYIHTPYISLFYTLKSPAVRLFLILRGISFH